MAETHMKHPRDELYAGLVPAIRARGASPFDAALTELAEAVESDAGNERVETAWQAVDDAIRTIASSTDASVRQQLVAVANMVRTAADEYAIGVVDGEIDNAHEYQDAWGFVQVAQARLDALSPAGEAERRRLRPKPLKRWKASTACGPAWRQTVRSRVRPARFTAPRRASNSPRCRWTRHRSVRAIPTVHRWH